ncbi:MAG: NADH:flavin oxidoreductase/NADH oxidase [Tepidisphaerales bacterium]
MDRPVPLFSPLTQRGVTFRNRLGVSPMCMYACEDGVAGDFHLVHLGGRALGGFGLVIAEATAVSPEGRITGNDLGLWDDRHIAPLAKAVALVRGFGAVAGVQLAHAGWKAGSKRPWDGHSAVLPPPHPGGWRPLGVTCEPFSPRHPVPMAIDRPAEIVAQFAAAAERACRAGFDLVEIHAAHGYLLHSFHSPISNRRTDGYGGGFDGRTRLTREVVAAVRAVWPADRPLWIRFSCTDYVEGGWDVDQSVELARVLRGLGVDCVDCSSGGIRMGVSIPTGPGYQVAFAERIRREAGVATAAVGEITTAAQANDIVAAGRADVVLLGRAALREPHFPLRAAVELQVKPPVPGMYERGF